MADEKIARWLELDCLDQDVREEMLELAGLLCKHPVVDGESWSWETGLRSLPWLKALAMHERAGRVCCYWTDDGKICVHPLQALFDWRKTVVPADSTPLDPIPPELIKNLAQQAYLIVECLWSGAPKKRRELEAHVWPRERVEPESVERAIDRAKSQLRDLKNRKKITGRYIIESKNDHWWLVR